MELLPTLEALDACTLSFTSIAIMGTFVHEIIKHGANIDPFLEGCIE